MGNLDIIAHCFKAKHCIHQYNNMTRSFLGICAHYKKAAAFLNTVNQSTAPAPHQWPIKLHRVYSKTMTKAIELSDNSCNEKWSERGFEKVLLTAGIHVGSISLIF